MYVLYVYTYAHLSFKKGTDPTQARSRRLVDIYKKEMFSFCLTPPKIAPMIIPVYMSSINRL